MPTYVPRSVFWNGRRVLVTGATGFKGTWLCSWLEELGAELSVTGLRSHHDPSIFDLSGIGERWSYVEVDLRDRPQVRDFVRRHRPEIVLHLASQALVFTGIDEPVSTFETNMLGTLNVLEACREVPDLRAVVIVTSDKVYGDTGRICGERDPLGGHDPYSASKACAELIAATYARHYLTAAHSKGLATARAGNVIGGGDFNAHRLLPDLVRGAETGEPVTIRNPNATRPWQHVLDALNGYLCLAERLWIAPAFASKPWNFGPIGESEWTVAQIADVVTERFGGGWRPEPSDHSGEAALLRLSSRRAVEELDWRPRLSTMAAIHWATDGYLALRAGQSTAWIGEQIARYQSLPGLSANPMEDRIDAAVSA